MNRPKVLIAGATGHLGKHLVREFKERGLWVRSLARNPAKLEAVNPWSDDVFIGDATNLQTLEEACDGVDIVFSTVGASVSPTFRRGRASFREIDYSANLNLLEVAARGCVRKFGYVSVFRGPLPVDLEYIRAHEDFADALLKASGLECAVIRPTGYFWSWAEVLKMAATGRVYLTGDLETRENPIHEADLARVCVDTVLGQKREVAVGGPEVLSRREIIELAFTVLGRPPKVTVLPVWLANMIVKAVQPVDHRWAELAAFIVATTQVDLVAPRHGTQTLKAYFEELAPNLVRSA